MILLSDDEIKAILQTVPIDPIAEGKFFEDLRFFPGRLYDQQTRKVIQPHESLKIYEHLLSQIKRVDSKRYERMHKGSPFYIMGWLAYEMKDYEQGVFYMDAALSEDEHNFPDEWMKFPAASFIFLDDKNTNAAALEITIQITREVDFQLQRFSHESGISLTKDALVNQFLKIHSSDSKYRSIITSLLTFLLESKYLLLNLELRSRYGGTLEPFITHLFKGALIFESLLKRKYAASGNTLGKYLAAAKIDLDLKAEVYNRPRQPYKFDELPLLIGNWEKEDFQERAIATAYAVRNTAGHDLAWQDVFSGDLYRNLFEGIVNAILWSVKKAYKIK